MPLYDYKCRTHGIFQELARVDHADRPGVCPVCQLEAPRIIMIPPQLLTMAPERRKAFAINEKSIHEPQFSTLAQRVDEHRHGRGCGCAPLPKKSAAVMTADGKKIFPTMRPWMISH